jgi:HK97 family phage portal protein
MQQQVDFFTNRARPSFILSTDQLMNREQADMLSEIFRAKSAGGGVPVLSAGLKPIQIQTTAVDAQLAETMKMSDQAVALAFRMPLQVLGIGGTPFASTEMLMQAWVASGLGFALNHVEEAFGKLFRLRGVPDEYVEFSTKSLLRSAYKDRVEGLVRGVQGGIYSPDEARAEEELPAVPGGHGAEPRVQQQVVPLSYGSAMQPPTPALPAPPEADDDEERHAPDASARRLRSHARALH